MHIFMVVALIYPVSVYTYLPLMLNNRYPFIEITAEKIGSPKFVTKIVLIYNHSPDLLARLNIYIPNRLLTH